MKDSKLIFDKIRNNARIGWSNNVEHDRALKHQVNELLNSNQSMKMHEAFEAISSKEDTSLRQRMAYQYLEAICS